jgi:dihydrofolate reductase
LRKVIYLTSLSADGFIEAAGGDSTSLIPDEELHRHFNELESAIDTHLYGRRFYELMASYWPSVDGKPTAPSYEVEYARIWKAVPKVVFSSTLDRVEWNARLFKGDARSEVARLKQLPGLNMSLGGTTLASTLAADGLIDEYRLYVMPVILGAGKSMFQLRDKISLQLVEHRRFSSGVVLLHYARRAYPQ